MSTAALAWSQFRFERKQFWRNPSAAFFNFLLPILFLVLTASAFSGDEDVLEVLVPGHRRDGRRGNDLHRACLRFTFRRDEGILKRDPRHPDAGERLSRRPGRIRHPQRLPPGGHHRHARQRGLRCRVARRIRLLLAGFTALGVICFASLGVAFSHVIPNEDAAPAFTNAVFLPLIFISGVFYSADDLPKALLAIAEALPLKHLSTASRTPSWAVAQTSRAARRSSPCGRSPGSSWRCASSAGNK